MTLLEVIIYISSCLLLGDTVYSLYYFPYTYILEIKKRYANQRELPALYQFKLGKELTHEIGITRTLVQSTYLFWFFSIIFTKLIVLPIIISICGFITNIIYSKPYISPMGSLVNLIISFMVYLFVILTFYFNLV